MIKLESISKSYDGLKALNNVSLQIPKAKITILAGADGAGKSTLFKIILGLEKKDKGRIFLENKDIKNKFSKITSIAGYMPEKFSLYMDLSVEENMNFFSDIYKIPKNKREKTKEELLSKTGMIEFKNRRAGALSGGMKQKLSLSTILLSSPDIIILDEPTTGVDPLSRLEFLDIIEELKEQGKTIVMSTPYLDEAERGDNIIFLKKGSILVQDSINNLKEKFPAKVYIMTPEENIFEIMEKLKESDNYKSKIFMKGRTIKFLKTKDISLPDFFEYSNLKKITPSLEDLFIYYERKKDE